MTDFEWLYFPKKVGTIPEELGEGKMLRTMDLPTMSVFFKVDTPRDRRMPLRTARKP